MKNPVDWVKRMLAEKPEQNHATAPEREATSQSLVMQGIVSNGGSHLILVHPETPAVGVKLVTVSVAFLEHHKRVMEAYELLQVDLAALPTSLRKRKARKAKMPDLET